MLDNSDRIGMDSPTVGFLAHFRHFAGIVHIYYYLSLYLAVQVSFVLHLFSVFFLFLADKRNSYIK